MNGRGTGEWQEGGGEEGKEWAGAKVGKEGRGKGHPGGQKDSGGVGDERQPQRGTRAAREGREEGTEELY